MAKIILHYTHKTHYLRWHYFIIFLCNCRKRCPLDVGRRLNRWKGPRYKSDLHFLLIIDSFHSPGRIIFDNSSFSLRNFRYILHFLYVLRSYLLLSSQTCIDASSRVNHLRRVFFCHLFMITVSFFSRYFSSFSSSKYLLLIVNIV